MLVLLASACGADIDPPETDTETSTTVIAPGENSPVCAPLVEVGTDTGDTTETGGDEMFPPEGETPVLYT
jgi:hypothetical protein